MPGRCGGGSGIRQPPKRRPGTPRSPTAPAACRRCRPGCRRARAHLRHRAQPRPPPSTALCVALVCHLVPGNACFDCTQAQPLRHACVGRGWSYQCLHPEPRNRRCRRHAQCSVPRFLGQHVCQPPSVVRGWEAGRTAEARGAARPQTRPGCQPASLWQVRGGVHSVQNHTNYCLAALGPRGEPRARARAPQCSNVGDCVGWGRT